jgi:gluconate 2-dehydrogenase gamma chain
MLLKMTVEGFFSHPVHSASRGRIGWRMAGFPGAYAEHSRRNGGVRCAIR